MNTSDTSTVSFEDKCSILTEFLVDEFENPNLVNMLGYFSVFFRLALLVNTGSAVATDKGVGEINELWDFILEELIGGDVDEPISSLDDIRYLAKDGIFPKEDVDRIANLRVEFQNPNA